jgi:glucan endo-1,3-alpha-glucosidase
MRFKGRLEALRALAWGACVGMVLPGICPDAPAAQPSTVIGAPSQTSANGHYVFAHYMVAFATYGQTVEGYRREIMEAQAANIDGFALNVGAWDDYQSYYKTNVALMFQAAEQLGTGFKLFFSVDFEEPSNIVSMVEQYAGRPNAFRYQGKLVLSTYGHQDLDWNTMLSQLRTNGVDVFFVPHFFPPSNAELPNAGDAQAILGLYTNLLDGLFLFDPAGTLEETTASTAQYAYVVQQSNKLFMASCTPHYWGCFQPTLGRRYFETLGGEGTELQWEQLIGNQPDWVEIVTWNDFNESTYLSPIIDPGRYTSAVSPRRNTHAGYLELSKYYITWYKCNQQPAIDRDALFYFYRIHPMALVITNDIPVTTLMGDVEDQLFLTTMLKRPATLVVTSGGVRSQYDQAVGINHVRVPFNVGSQVFEVWRDGLQQLVINAPPVITTVTNYNFFPTSGFAYFLDGTNGPAVPASVTRPAPVTRP